MIIDRHKEFVLRIARNLLDADPQVKKQIIRVYPNLTQRDIYAAIVLLTEQRNKRGKQNE
jgi:uncharacterized protein (DUF433 family)